MPNRFAILAVVLLLDRATLVAQQQTRIAEGQVVRPGVGGRPRPVAGQWVVLHRVGADRAGPLDSVRTRGGGTFRFRYSASGAADALYFVSATYSGIAYFSPPLRAAVVRGGDADIMVYDTTNDTTALRVQGRHLVVSLPRGSKREMAEIFEIENTGARTVIPRDSIPVFITTMPADAESLSVAPGDVSAAAVKFRPGRAALYAPLSPGVRQLVVTYKLPASSFPVSVPLERATSVVEVLMEDPRGEVVAPGLSEVASATIEGRMFRRFLAQDLPASTVIRVNAPAPARENRTALRMLLAVLAAAMIGVLAWRLMKRDRLQTSDVGRPTPEVERLIGGLAALDARFERETNTPETQAVYEQERAELKSRIAAALAAGNERV